MRGYAYYTREVIYSKTLVRGLSSNWSNLLQMYLVLLLGKQHRRAIMDFKDICKKVTVSVGACYHSQSNMIKDNSVVEGDVNNVIGVHTSKRPDGWYRTFDKKRKGR